ncbi:MAG TPA: hypothetical protein VFA86_06410 [Gammaproteobacteria bacterium]|nr:hypothetical protein [Gammaproteobacteria bacterium]
MRQAITKLAVVAVALGLAGGAAFAQESSGSGGSPDINKLLSQTADRVNATLPRMVNDGTRLDSVRAGKGHLQYNYTLVKYTANQMDGAKLHAMIQPRLVKQVCSSRKMQVYMHSGVDVTYVYHGKDGKQITSVTVHQSDCKSAGAKSD